MTISRESRLQVLRARIEDYEAPRTEASPLRLGVKSIDGLLKGGLAFGRVHAVRGLASVAFLMALAARTEGSLVWCVRSDANEQLHMEGAKQLGLDPHRFIVVQGEADASVLASMETALASGAVPLVIASLEGGCDRLAGRRVQLAAEKGNSLGLLQVGAKSALNWAETAWVVGSEPSMRARPRWRLELVRSRRSVTRAWSVEWDAKETALHLA